MKGVATQVLDKVISAVGIIMPSRVVARNQRGVALLKPTFVPEPFTFVRASTNDLTGFGPFNKNQITLIYGNPKVSGRGIDIRHGLLKIHCTTEPSGPLLSTQAVLRPVEERAPLNLQLTLANGTLTTAWYYESLLRMNNAGNGGVAWDNTGPHALVFRMYEFTIGIHGNRRGGIDRDALIRIGSTIDVAECSDC
jgi:hypothetical protein